MIGNQTEASASFLVERVWQFNLPQEDAGASKISPQNRIIQHASAICRVGGVRCRPHPSQIRTRPIKASGSSRESLADGVEDDHYRPRSHRHPLFERAISGLLVSPATHVVSWTQFAGSEPRLSLSTWFPPRGAPLPSAGSR